MTGRLHLACELEREYIGSSLEGPFYGTCLSLQGVPTVKGQTAEETRAALAEAIREYLRQGPPTFSPLHDGYLQRGLPHTSDRCYERFWFVAEEGARG